MARKLGPEEKALWGRVVATVKPLGGSAASKLIPPSNLRHPRASGGPSPEPSSPSKVPSKNQVSGMDPRLRGDDDKSVGQLDGTWDRRIHKGAIVPDVSVDLHETTLSGAYARLDRTLDHAIHHKLRVVLLVTGKPRGHDRASGQGRGAIAAVVRDWLAASRHAAHISAVRQAHPRHGGEGALYIVLKR